jgi:hypothetical protein
MISSANKPDRHGFNDSCALGRTYTRHPAFAHASAWQARAVAQYRLHLSPLVMAGLDPAIHVFLAAMPLRNVDARHKAGHDEPCFARVSNDETKCIRHTTAIPRRENARAMHGSFAPRITEGAGKAGRTMHPQPRVRCCWKHTSVVTTGSPETPGLPCAMVLRFPSRSPRCAKPVSHRRHRHWVPGPHDFAVRAGADRLAAPPASIASVPRS